MKTAKRDIKQFKRSSENVQKHFKTLSDKTAEMEDKLTKSMRNNLMFYGIREGGQNADCEVLVKDICAEILKVGSAHELIFDRVYRVGSELAKTPSSCGQIPILF